MVNELWGVAGRQGLRLPENALLTIILLTAGVVLVAFLHRVHAWRTFREMTRSQWALLVALSGAALLLSELFPLSIPWSSPYLRSNPATSHIALLSATPYLLAGLALNVPAAVVVGLVAGVGRIMGQSGAPLDIVTVGLAAGISATLMRQNFAGRLFEVFRQPAVAGTIGRLVIVLGSCLTIFATMLSLGSLFSALDGALYVSLWSALPLLIEGAVGGAVAAAVLWIVPQWRPDRGVVPSPFQRSVQRQLVTAFLSFAAIVVLLSALVAFYFSARSTERALAEQMVDHTEASATGLGVLQTEMTSTLSQFSADPALAAGPAAKSAVLGRVQASRLFSEVRLVNQFYEVLSAVGDSAAIAPLNAAERLAVNSALTGSGPHWAIDGTARTISLAVPGAPTDVERSVLLASVAPESLAEISGDLAENPGLSFIIDEASRVILSSEEIDFDQWSPPSSDQASKTLSDLPGRNVYETVDSTSGSRQLISIAPVPQSGWKVVTILPRSIVLRETLSIIGPLALLLLAVSGAFFVLVAGLGRDISRPIAEMGRASKAIAEGGGLERPVRTTHREDEIGQLSLAFSQMQRALRQRLDELSLLLSVSNDVAATINIDEGMAAVLQGVLRGTGAAGARAIVRNPTAPAPLVFAEGPAAESMASLDRAILLRLRSVDELAYGTAAEIEEGLGINPSPVAALFALPLKPAGEFQGVLLLAYRQQHYFDKNERTLLQTLTGQATVLVQNAHLFAAAEGGRRRLAAILASTTNGVLVTDQTDRVLLINPAMERAFGIQARDVAGRPVVDALVGVDQAGILARRLSLGVSAATSGAVDGKVELEANGRVFLAGISTVYSNEGKTMGRVAVLQDVTDIKELERMKSDFVAGISHDLLSPLTYMHNYASMLPITDDPNLEKEYAAKIMGGIDRMKRLVNDLLDLARIEAGLNLQFDEVDIGALLSEVAVEYASPAREHGLKLIVTAPGGLPSVVADPTLLRRAVTNLVTNGIKHAPQSGNMTLAAEKVGKEMVITVRDQGPGIAVVDQVHLFEKFYRGQGMSTAERARGSGLGLAIVKSVADHHGGRVWCESAPGAGSAFFLALPLNPKRYQ